MSLFRKKCTYCGKKIERRQEVIRDVKIPGFIGTRERAFCSEEHAANYQEEIREKEKQSSRSACCCG
jgi:hypothetical protein